MTKQNNQITSATTHTITSPTSCMADKLDWDALDTNPEQLKKVLDHGATLMSMGQTPSNILHTAVYRFHNINNDTTKNTLETIASHQSINPYINQKNSIGNTALHFAVTIQNLTAVKILLAHKADPNIVNQNERKPSEKCKNKEIEALLLDAEQNQTSVKMSKSKNAQTDKTSEAEITKNFTAVQNGQLPELPKGFNINYQNSLGNTLLHYAVQYNNPHLANFIRQYNPNLNIQNTSGNTPLHFAAHNGNLGTVELLVKQNADPAITNYNLNPPVNLAAINGFNTVADYLGKITSPDISTNIVPDGSTTVIEENALSSTNENSSLKIATKTELSQAIFNESQSKNAQTGTDGLPNQESTTEKIATSLSVEETTSWFSIGDIFSWVKSCFWSDLNTNHSDHSHDQDDAAYSPMNSLDAEELTGGANSSWLNSIFSFVTNLWKGKSFNADAELTASVNHQEIPNDEDATKELINGLPDIPDITVSSDHDSALGGENETE